MARPRSYHHGGLRSALLVATRKMIVEEGHGAISLRKVTKAIGVSHTAPQRHFSGLAGLLAAVAAQGYRELKESMELPATEPPLRRMQQVGVGYLCFAMEAPNLFRFIYDPALRVHRHLEGLGAASRQTFDYVVATVAACQEVHAVREGDPKLIARFAWSAVHGGAVLALDGQLDAEETLDTSSFAASLTQQIFLGLRRD